jgi:hypothetical protein
MNMHLSLVGDEEALILLLSSFIVARLSANPHTSDRRQGVGWAGHQTPDHSEGVFTANHAKEAIAA